MNRQEQPCSSIINTLLKEATRILLDIWMYWWCSIIIMINYNWPNENKSNESSATIAFMSELLDEQKYKK